MRRRLAWIGLVLVFPLLPLGLAFADHLRSYDGWCGPYPLDIPAVRCSFEVYAQRFFDGDAFQVLGLMLITLASWVFAALAVGLGWLVRAVTCGTARRA